MISTNKKESEKKSCKDLSPDLVAYTVSTFHKKCIVNCNFLFSRLTEQLTEDNNFKKLK